jgi:hypothetical protein
MEEGTMLSTVAVAKMKVSGGARKYICSNWNWISDFFQDFQIYPHTTY